MRKTLMFFVFTLYACLVFAQTEKKPFKFALITDTHVSNPNNNEDLCRTVADINAQPDIDFVIHSGDVTEFGADEELQTAKSILDSLRKPLYIVPGNHDSNWSESGTNSFLRIFGGETFAFEHKGYKLIGMASGPNMRMSPAQIPRENMNRFFEELKKTDKNRPLIVVNHYPMDDGVNNWFEVLDALRPYNVKLMLCGHGHVNRPMNFEGANAAMCRSSLRAGDEYGGYTIITVTPDTICLQERLVSGLTKDPWLGYSTKNRPQWNENPPRPDYRMNTENNCVLEIWRIQERSDIGGGMALEGKKLIYTNTAGEIKAVNAANGKPLWSYKTDGKIYSTPTLYKNVVWCASSDTFLYGLRLENGNLKFRQGNHKAVVSSPVCADGKVMIAGGDGVCRAWNVKNGQPAWEYHGVKNFVLTRPLIKNGTLFFGSWGNEFYAVDIASGTLKWKWNNGQTNRMFSPAQVWPVATHKRIYLVSPDRYMTVLDEKTGTVIWRVNDKDNRVRESIGLSEDENTVYAKTMDGKIIAVDATVPERKIKWISSGEDMGYELAPTALVEKNGIVYAPTDKGLIFAFRASDGTFLWKYRISSGLINMILPTDRNELYVSSMDGALVKLRVN
ncbi:MAG: PQQ-binding-like beta-propeller repeat protein [Dysgonamonadaceae bacterium]|jgi:outer membrane protein assembly factor BamB/predicted phosphodiesterase|nr:PQQ-binding-like beta-propeller repeat protein [Dysgonamonadaceae bacterium]